MMHWEKRGAGRGKCAFVTLPPSLFLLPFFLLFDIPLALALSTFFSLFYLANLFKVIFLFPSLNFSKMSFSAAPFCCVFFILFFFPLALFSHCADGYSSSGKRVVLARVFIFKAAEKPETMVSQPIGTVDIAETIPGKTKLNGTLNGLAPGDHGFHFHQFGDISQACMAAGPHFNPSGKRHGAQNSAERHVGDLGNLMANDEGVAVVDIRDHLVALNGVNSVVGRALVVHEKADDMGKGGNEESTKTGNSGKRIGCGVVGLIREE